MLRSVGNIPRAESAVMVVAWLTTLNDLFTLPLLRRQWHSRRVAELFSRCVEQKTCGCERLINYVIMRYVSSEHWWSEVEFSPATREAWVRFPASALSVSPQTPNCWTARRNNRVLFWYKIKSLKDEIFDICESLNDGSKKCKAWALTFKLCRNTETKRRHFWRFFLGLEMKI